MKIERIDKDEIVGLRCPKTRTSILWDDEDIADVLPGTVGVRRRIKPVPRGVRSRWYAFGNGLEVAL
jgi:hypothetical protein